MTDVGLLQVRNKFGEMVPLGTLVQLKEVNGPVSVGRYNLYTAAAVNGNVPPDVSSGEAGYWLRLAGGRCEPCASCSGRSPV